MKLGKGIWSVDFILNFYDFSEIISNIYDIWLVKNMFFLSWKGLVLLVWLKWLLSLDYILEV